MPKENEREEQKTPDYVRNNIRVSFVSSIDGMLAAALLPAAWKQASLTHYIQFSCERNERRRVKCPT